MQLSAGFQVIYVKLPFRIPLVPRRPVSREQSQSRLKKATPKKERGSEDKLDSPQPTTDYDEKVKIKHESKVAIEMSGTSLLPLSRLHTWSWFFHC